MFGRKTDGLLAKAGAGDLRQLPALGQHLLLESENVRAQVVGLAPHLAPQGGIAEVLHPAAEIADVPLVPLDLHVGVDGGSRSTLLEFGAISWSRVEAGEYWRLLAAVFIHFDGVHLLANMGTFLLVGPPLAHTVGPWRLLLLFIATGVGANIISHETDRFPEACAISRSLKISWNS